MVTTRRYAITNLNPADDRRPGEVIEAVNQAITPSYHGSLAVASDPFPGLDRLIELELELDCGVAVARLTPYEAKVLAQQFPHVNVRALTFLRPADMWDDRDEVPSDPDLPEAWAVRFRITDAAGAAAPDVKIVARLPGVAFSYKAVTDARGEAVLSLSRSDAEVSIEPQHSFWSRALGRLSTAQLLGLNEIVLDRLVPEPGFQWDVRVSGRAELPDEHGEAVRVALIDTGIAEHPCLPDVWRQNFVESERHLRTVGDPRGHGTAMAGIICADGSNGGVRGYAPGVHLRSYRVVPRIGSAVDIDVAVALTQAVEDGAELVCMPLSAPRTSPAPFAIQQALRFAADRGVICVLAAGNEGTDLGWPSAFREENCLAVGAYGMFDRVPADTTHADYVQDYPATRGCFLASFSNHAAESFEHPDLLAPGVACVTTSPGGVGAISGTSAATAHVAGIAAVLLETFPDDRILPADQKIQRIRSRLLGIAESFSWGRAMEGWGQAMLR